jgi:predicted ATPase
MVCLLREVSFSRKIPTTVPRWPQADAMSQVRPDRSEFTRLVRGALNRLYDPASLSAHPLAHLLSTGDAQIESGSQSALVLRQRLLEAIELLKPEPQVDSRSSAWRLYRLLELRYAEARGPAEVQHQLAASKSQYYREHEHALLQLTELLWQQASQGAVSGALMARSAGAESARHNLPLAITSFIGREAQLAQVRQLLGKTRLLTLTGAGGSGKTRLALEVATALVDSFQQGVWQIDLAPLGEMALLPQTVAHALGIHEESGQSVEATLIRTLSRQQRMLVLDNCEHLVDACARLAETLLKSCPKLTILATSREPLHISGETLFHVPTLSTPDPQRLPGLDQLRGYEAIQLFVERAAATEPNFALSTVNAEAVAHICARLDGIPLAIELTAARMEALSVQQIDDRLHDRFHLLTGGSRTALPRHQTLRAMVDWSVDLLTGKQKTLFKRLSVFAGGWALEEAEAVCSGDPVESQDVLEVLSELVAKSLVMAEHWSGEVRYRMLETLRQYAYELLIADGGAHELQCMHAEYFLELAERSETAFVGADLSRWLERREREQDNFRAALRWAINNEDATGETALRIATALCRFGSVWQIRSRYRRESLDWLSAAVSRSTEARPSVRAAALQMAGHQAYKLCELDRARAYLEDSARLYRTMGSSGVPPEVLSTMGRLAGLRGSYDEGSTLLREAMRRASQLEDNRTAQLGFWYLGEIQVRDGAWELASATLERGIAVSRELGDQHYAAHCVNELGAVRRHQGDARQAERLHEDSLAVFESISDTEGTASALHYLGLIALEKGDLAAASDRFQRSLTLNSEIGLRQEVPACLEGLARVAAACGDWQGAARIVGAGEALREALGVPLPPVDRIAQECLRAELRARLGEPELAEAMQLGAHMSLEEVTAGVLLNKLRLACE